MDSVKSMLGAFLGKARDAMKGAWSWYKGLYVGRKWYVRTLAAMVTLMVAVIVYFWMVDVNFLWLFGKSPGISKIKNPTVSEASEIYSADGVLIGKFFSENRTPVSYGDVNPVFWEVLIDTEDQRFYSHFGIDFASLPAVVKDLVVRHEARGASTITQQLAKNMFRVRTQYSTGLLGNIPGISMLIMKSKEWIIATKLEFMHSKEEILTMYANTVDFGSNSFGIKTACRTYFNTTPRDLTIEQAAALVGMLKGTTLYNPITNPENCLNRRNTVLNNMVENRHLSREACDSLKAIPIGLSYSTESYYDGTAQYFREAVAVYLRDWCKENGYDLYSSGLKIHTTLDTRMQDYAERAALKQMRQVQETFNGHWAGQDPWRDDRNQPMPDFVDGVARKLPVYKALARRFPNDPDSVRHYLNLPHKVKLFDYANGTVEREMSTMDSLRYMLRFLHCSFVAMEPQTGEVKAWVGDVDFATWQYDKVTAMRQPGSTFKLFVYTEAMNQGLTPCDKRRDEYISLEVYDTDKHRMTTWAPTNADGVFTGDSMPLKTAFAKSINSVAVRLGQELVIKNVAKTARDMGIRSPLDEQPSLALGASDVNLLELANAYCTVANDGKHVEPVLVTRILDSEGKTVYTGPKGQKQVIPYKSAFYMQQLLRGGITEPGGTSQRLNGFIGGIRDTDFGGKTGTSNRHADAWFMGVSPNIVVGAWVGGEYRSIHFRTGELGQGSRTALPICGYFLESLMNDPAFKRYHGKFRRPDDFDVPPSAYMCQYVPMVEDTLLLDSLLDDEFDMFLEGMYDEDGNPIPVPDAGDAGDGGEGEAPGADGEGLPGGEPRKRGDGPREVPVRFEDL